MLVCEAPDSHIEIARPTLFLAGGITNCPDWQSDIIRYLAAEDPDIVVYNPRRENFPIEDPGAAEEQIKWEHARLRFADMLLFWFSRGSLNPITLYELGRWGNSCNRPLIVGIDPEYQRKTDVEIQTHLSRPNVTICYDLKELAYETVYQMRLHREYSGK